MTKSSVKSSTKSLDNVEVSQAIYAELENAINNDKWSRIKQIILMITNHIALDKGKLWKNLLLLNIEKLLADGNEKLVTWMSTLKEGDYIEVFSERENKWFEAKILKRDGVDMSVHYLGWQSKYDEKVDTINKLICPTHVFTKPKNKAVKPLFIPVVSSQDLTTNGSSSTVDGESIPAVVVVEEVPVLKTMSGRKVKARVEEVKTPAKKQKVEKVEVDTNDWICGVCNLLEAADGTDLLLCDGACKRSFHSGCLVGSNSTPPKPADDSWLCGDCANCRHMCFVCKEKGEDYEDVFKCSMGLCGKFYHRECLEKAAGYDYLSTEFSTTQKVVPTPTGEKKTVDALSFRCPQHACDTCFEFYGLHSAHDLTKCLMCPRAYHTNCISPGCRWNSMCLLCPDHPSAFLPSQDQVFAHRSSSASGSSSGVTPGANPFSAFYDQLVIPSAIPHVDNLFDTHYRHVTQITDDVENLGVPAPNFQKIRANDYDTLTDKMLLQLSTSYTPEVCCECTISCGEQCLNRVSRIECCEIKVNRNSDPVCHVGVGCGNRAIQSRQYADYKPMREFKMGWGLQAVSDVAQGALIIEYVGEVIDYHEVTRRMVSQRDLTPGDKDFYIMELDSGVYLDGKFKGNDSRFINHSCGPNAELQRWIVKNQMRIAIVASRDIRAGEFFSYDYQFDTSEDSIFVCHCGAEACRGTMAPRKKDKSGTIPTDRNTRARLIEAGRMKERRTDENREEEEWSRSYTGRMNPGDPLVEISKGPIKATFAPGEKAHIFLVRNVQSGSDLCARRALLEAEQDLDAALMESDSDSD